MACTQNEPAKNYNIPVINVSMECFNKTLREQNLSPDMYKKYVSATIYDDRADLTINEKDTKLLIADVDEFQNTGMRSYLGNFPKSKTPLRFDLRINVEKQKAHYFTLTEKGDNFWVCDVELPANFTRPVQTTNKCVKKLMDLVKVKSDTFPCFANKKEHFESVGEFEGIMILKNKKWIELTPTQAMSISANWDYDSKKFRENACSFDTGYIDFSKDNACELLSKVQEFIAK